MRTTLSTTRLTRVVVSVTAALALAACGGGDDPTIASQGGNPPGAGALQPTPVAGIDAAFNATDVAFITDMKPHHDGAIAMAELAGTRAADAQVKALATKIVGAQDPEIAMMRKMATAWGVDLEAAPSGMSMGGGSMAEGEDVAVLTPLSGAAFDKEFLTRMKAHHESAVEMAAVELAGGENPQAKQMAQEITTAQKAEIAEMTTLLAAL